MLILACQYVTLKVYTHLFQKSENDLIDLLEKSSHNLLTEANEVQLGVRTRRKYRLEWLKKV